MNKAKENNIIKRFFKDNMIIRVVKYSIYRLKSTHYLYVFASHILTFNSYSSLLFDSKNIVIFFSIHKTNISIMIN